MYKNLLLSARESADKRFAEKGLSESSFQNFSVDESKLVSQVSTGLVNKRQVPETKTVEEEDDFLTKYYNQLHEQNKQLKAQGSVKEPDTFDFKPKEIGKNLVQDLEEALGITTAQAAGIVGNLDHETGGFKFMQELKPVVPGSRGGLGFAQWTGDRRVAFEAWGKENNVDLNSYEANRDYLIYEISNTSEGRFLSELEESTTVEEATKIVSKRYLRPGIPKMNSRLSRAKSYMENN